MSLQNVQAELAELLFNKETTNVITPVENFSIYRNNIRSALISTLQETYPLIVKLLGEDFFKVACREYIAQYPSRSSNLNDYGEYFSHFLAHYPPVKNLIYLVEVAEFEWICHRLYFAADHSGFDVSRLRPLVKDQYENIHFSLHPALVVKKFHYPMLDIIDLCNHRSDKEVDITQGSINLIIARRDFEIKLIPIADADFQFLNAIQEGATLGQAYMATQRYDTKWDIEKKLVDYIQQKVIVDCDLVLLPVYNKGVQGILPL